MPLIMQLSTEAQTFFVFLHEFLCHNHSKGIFQIYIINDIRDFIIKLVHTLYEPTFDTKLNLIVAFKSATKW